MRVLFCSDPLHSRRVDEAYQAEHDAAQSDGAEVSLLDFEALAYENNAEGAVARVAAAAAQTLGVYRGWMLSVGQYAQLFEALQERRITLINTPEQYAHCHLLPLSYGQIAAYTPKTVWAAKEDFSIDTLAALLEPFGAGPVIVKDYVKSRKHEWAEACFIPSASDTEAAAQVAETFIRRQGADLTGGLVFREFEEFEPLTVHPQSSMPLTREFRLIFWNGKLLVSSRYWDAGNYLGELPPAAKFTAIAGTIPSRFFTMDVARTVRGEWRIIELGDAQVAELPSEVDALTFYADLLTI